MDRIKVTDLEQFALEQVYRPYQNGIGIGDKRLERLNETFSLENARELLIHHRSWARLVLSRITKCNFYFPDYIKHPLVRFIKNAQKIDWE